jgi:hypothetical protein
MLQLQSEIFYLQSELSNLVSRSRILVLPKANDHQPRAWLCRQLTTEA